MERRNDSRKLLHLHAALHLADDGSVTGVVQDISPGGMFIETDRSHLPLNEALEIHFSFRAGQTSHELDLKAVVTRHADNGVALTFWGMNAVENQALYDLLKEMPVDVQNDKPLLS